MMYAQINALNRIISLRSEQTGGLIPIDNLDVIQSPQNYQFANGGFILDTAPSAYHTLDANGNWYLNNEVLQNAKEAMWQKIKQYRDDRGEGGIMLTISGVDYWFHSDTRSLIKYLFLLFFATIFSAAYTSPIVWKTMSDAEVPLTAETIRNIFFKVLITGNVLYGIGRQHRANMLASDDPLSYNYKTGSPPWPPVYGE